MEGFIIFVLPILLKDDDISSGKPNVKISHLWRKSHCMTFDFTSIKLIRNRCYSLIYIIWNIIMKLHKHFRSFMVNNHKSIY